MMKINRIIIGIDDSKYAEHAAAYGFNLARTFNAQVGLVNIVEPIVVTPIGGNDTMTGIPSEATTVSDMQMMNIQNDLADTIIERTINTYGEGLNITQFHEYGSTADGIINCSNQFMADLIVIGTHNRSGLDRLIMGSVAENVVRHSNIPVLVVPMPEGRD